MNNGNLGYKKVPAEYIVKCKPKTDEEIKEYHRKRLYEISLKTIGAVPWLDEPSEEQKAWIKRRMHGSARSWEVWNQ
jgi:hypothetical protein